MSGLEPGYLEGLRLFNEGAFWEAHEALEAVWLPLPKGDPEKRFYQALILLSAAFLHRGRGAARPALRCYRSAMAKLDGLPAVFLGLDLDTLREASARCFEPLAAGAPRGDLPPPPRLEVIE